MTDPARLEHATRSGHHGPVRPVMSVVVATRRRPRQLTRLMAALDAQEGVDPFEVVVVDDASDDETPAVVRDLAVTALHPVKILRTETSQGPGPARNLGWRAADAPLVAFTDDDCIPHTGWLRASID